MLKVSWFAVLSILTILTSSLLADEANPKIDFNSGTDVEKAVKEIKNQIQLRPLSKETLVSPLSALNEPDVTITGRVIGKDLPPILLNNREYQEALKYPPLLPLLPDSVRMPLENRWVEINNIRTDFLNEANRLEAEDTRLYNEGLQLDRDLEVLRRRRAQLEAELDNFNRTCTGRLPPDEYYRCERWRNDLNRRIDQYNADATAHNNRVAQWRNKVMDLRRRAGTATKHPEKTPFPLRPWIPQFERFVVGYVKPWSADAQRALDQHGPGTCSQPEYDRRKKEFDENCPSHPCDPAEKNCIKLDNQIQKNIACRDAAKELNECFGNNNPEYSRIEQEAKEALRICMLIYGRECKNEAPRGFCRLLRIDRADGIPYNCSAICNRNGTYVPFDYRPFPRGKPCGVDEGEFFADPGQIPPSIWNPGNNQCVDE